MKNPLRHRIHREANDADVAILDSGSHSQIGSCYNHVLQLSLGGPGVFLQSPVG